eukprot:1839756-Rhodomonas_salina.1
MESPTRSHVEFGTLPTTDCPSQSAPRITLRQSAFCYQIASERHGRLTCSHGALAAVGELVGDVLVDAAREAELVRVREGSISRQVEQLVRRRTLPQQVHPALLVRLPDRPLLPSQLPVGALGPHRALHALVLRIVGLHYILVWQAVVTGVQLCRSLRPLPPRLCPLQCRSQHSRHSDSTQTSSISSSEGPRDDTWQGRQLRVTKAGAAESRPTSASLARTASELRGQTRSSSSA